MPNFVINPKNPKKRFGIAFMILHLPPVWRFIARHFAGMRKSLARHYVSQDVTACGFAGITYPYDSKVMDGKRLVALAAGAIEAEEIALAEKYIDANDIVVEFGSGLGIAAARMQKAVTPKAHFCFEANPVAVNYAKNLFQMNGLQIAIDQRALGDGSKTAFYAADDYILSSFDPPKHTTHFRKIEIPTVKLKTVIIDKRPTVIFCDIEGAEDKFLPPEDLAGVAKVIIELHPGLYGAEIVQRIKDRFLAAGFNCAAQSRDTYCFLR
jgi:FkbM family methyltransferase